MRKSWLLAVLFAGILVFGASAASAGDIWAGQNEVAGSVHFDTEIDGFGEPTGLIIDLEANGGWKITEYHIHVVDDANADTCDPGSFPLNKPGNPKVGHFDWSWSGMATAYFMPIVIPESEIGDGDLVIGENVYIAVHVIVINADGREETGWLGECSGSPMPQRYCEWPGSRWGCSFKYMIGED